MRAAIENHIREVNAYYRPLILQSAGRLKGGDRLLDQFDQSVRAFHRDGRRQVSGVIERVNELAVAKRLLFDPHLEPAVIAYEPAIVAGPRFDFVITSANGQTHFVEVKTVSPQSASNEASWRTSKYQGRQVVLNPSAATDDHARPLTPIPIRPTFAAHPAFLRYALQTEAKFAAHFAAKPGHGVLVFCGDGFGWNVADVNDFAQSYQARSLATAQQVRLPAGTLHGFAMLIRPQVAVEPSAWNYPVSGSAHMILDDQSLNPFPVQACP